MANLSKIFMILDQFMKNKENIEVHMIFPQSGKKIDTHIETGQTVYFQKPY